MDDQIFDQNIRQELPSDIQQPQQDDKWQFLKNKKVIFGSLIALIVLIGGLWFLLSGNGGTVNEKSSNVLLYIKGPTQLTSGNETEYRIVYANEENGDLTQASMEVFFPSNFKFKSSTPSSTSSAGNRFNLPMLKSGEEAEVKIRGQLSGSSGEEKEIRAKLSYRLSNFNSEFAVEEKFFTVMTPPNLSLEITGPVEVSGGQDTTFTINYSNVSFQSFENLALLVTYPAGYKFTSAVPSPSKNGNLWTIPKLDSGAGGKIEITGSFVSDGTDQIVTGELGINNNNSVGTLITSSTVFKVVTAPLSLTVQTEPESHVGLGDSIEYNLEYSNNGAIGMTNLVITMNLEGTVLDLSRLRVSDAIVTGSTITWKAATLRNLSLLAPNQKGEISFTVPLKSNLSTNIKNQIVKATGSIYSAEISKPIHTPEVVVKLSSELGVLVSVDRVAGASPLQVGKPTTIAVNFLLTNLSNDLENAEVRAFMPLSANAWKNVIVPDSEKDRLSFDPTSGLIRWKIGKLAAFVGKFTPALSVTFQLEIIPTEADKGQMIQFLRDIQATGYDTFIAQEIKSEKIERLDSGELDGGGAVE